MIKYCKEYSEMLVNGWLFFAICCAPSMAADDNEKQWDRRLNGVWKVTSYVHDGKSMDFNERRYVFNDGQLVAAEPINLKTLELPKLPFGPHNGGPLPSNAGGQSPPDNNAMDESADCKVRLSVYRAKTNAKKPHDWIDLRTKWEEPAEISKGLYEINENSLRLVLFRGGNRPKSLSPPTSRYTRSSDGPIVIRMDRLTKAEPGDE